MILDTFYGLIFGSILVGMYLLWTNYLKFIWFPLDAKKAPTASDVCNKSDEIFQEKIFDPMDLN